jgi:hypothetical protein
MGHNDAFIFDPKKYGLYTRHLGRVVLDVKAISIILSEQRILAHIIESTYGARIKRWELDLRAKSWISSSREGVTTMQGDVSQLGQLLKLTKQTRAGISAGGM